jgi:hypothetical protein
MKVEHAGGVKAMTDEQIEQAIEAIQTMIEQRAGESANFIEGKAETVALPAPMGEQRRRKRPNRLLEYVDTAVGPSERGKRKP